MLRNRPELSSEIVYANANSNSYISPEVTKGSPLYTYVRLLPYSCLTRDRRATVKQTSAELYRNQHVRACLTERWYSSNDGKEIKTQTS